MLKFNTIHYMDVMFDAILTVKYSLDSEYFYIPWEIDDIV